MQIDIRLCILVAVELCVWLTAGALSCLRGRRLLCVALLLLSLSPLTRIVLELVSNLYCPIKVPDYAFLIRLPFYIRLLGSIVLLAAVVNLPQSSQGAGDSDA
jgi:hypothetical protein